jgi:hypothetical protein
MVIFKMVIFKMVNLSDGHFAKPDLAFGRMDTLFVDKSPLEK